MTGAGNPPERELVERCVDGDKAAFGDLVERTMQRAYYLAFSIVGHHEDALDLSQDAFVRAWRGMRRFDPSRPFFPWYYSILRNLCLNALRDRKRRPIPFSRAGCEEGLDGLEWLDGGPPGRSVETGITVRRALARLRPEDREIILLKDLHGYAYREMAVMLSIPAGTVMSRLHAARSRFKSSMEEAASERR